MASSLALGAWASPAGVSAGDACGAGLTRRTMDRHTTADAAATAITSRAAGAGNGREPVDGVAAGAPTASAQAAHMSVRGGSQPGLAASRQTTFSCGSTRIGFATPEGVGILAPLVTPTTLGPSTAAAAKGGPIRRRSAGPDLGPSSDPANDWRGGDEDRSYSTLKLHLSCPHWEKGS